MENYTKTITERWECKFQNKEEIIALVTDIIRTTEQLQSVMITVDYIEFSYLQIIK